MESVGYILAKEVFVSCYACKETAVITLPGSNTAFNITVIRMPDLEKSNLNEGKTLKFEPSAQHNYIITCNSCSEELLTSNGINGTVNQKDRSGVGINMVSKKDDWIKMPRDMITGQIKFWDFEMSTRFVNYVGVYLTLKVEDKLGEILRGKPSNIYKKVTKNVKISKNTPPHKTNITKMANTAIKNIYKETFYTNIDSSKKFKPISIDSSKKFKPNYDIPTYIFDLYKEKFIENCEEGQIEKKTLSARSFRFLIKASDCPTWIKKKCANPNNEKSKHLIQLEDDGGPNLSCEYCHLISPIW